MGSERVLSPGPVPVSQGTYLARAVRAFSDAFCATFFHGSPKLRELRRGSRARRGCFDGRGSRMRSAGLAFSRGESRRAPLARPRLPVSRGERRWGGEAGGLELVMTHLRQITTRVALCASPGPMYLLLPSSPLGRGSIDAHCVWF